jgi:hypothetical protein
MGTKLRSVTIRVEHELWDRVVARAREERRPTAQLLRILVADAVTESRHADLAGASHA